MALRGTLIGFSDFFVGAIPGGAATSRPAPTKPGVPTSKAGAPRVAAAQGAAQKSGGLKAGILAAASKRVFPKAKPSGKPSPHRASLVTAANVRDAGGKAAIRLATKLKKAAAKNRTVVGAVRQPRTAKQRAAQAKLARAQGTVTAIAKRAKPIATKVAKKAVALKASLAKAAPIVAKLFAPSKRTVSPAQRAAAVRKTSTARAVVGTDANYLSVGEPGYDPTTEDGIPLDSSSGEPTYSEEPYTEEVFDPNVPPACVLPTEVPIPTRRPLPKEMSNREWENAPPDAIIYDAVTYGLPPGLVGSWNLFYGHSSPPPMGQIPGTTIGPDGVVFGKGSDSDTDGWVVKDKQSILDHEAGSTSHTDGVWTSGFSTRIAQNLNKFWSWANAGVVSANDAARLSAKKGWGPLIGSGKLHGLQYAVSDDRWFWENDYAPSWFPPIVQADAEVKRVNKEARDVAQAKCDSDRVTWEFDRATTERDRAKIAYDLEMAAETELNASAISASQLATQQAQFQAQQMQQQVMQEQQQIQQQAQQEAAQSQFELQTEQAELEYAQQQAQREGKVSDLMISQAQMEQQYLAQHPEEMAEEMSAEEEEGSDEEEGDESYAEEESAEGDAEVSAEDGDWDYSDDDFSNG